MYIVIMLPYNRKLAQRKTFTNFAFCQAFANLLLQNISFIKCVFLCFKLLVGDGIRECFLTNYLLMDNSLMFSFVPISHYMVQVETNVVCMTYVLSSHNSLSTLFMNFPPCLKKNKERGNEG